MAPQLNDSDKIAVLSRSPKMYADRVTHIYLTIYDCDKNGGDVRTVSTTFEKLRRKQPLSKIERDTLVGYYNLLKKQDPELGLT